MFIFIFSCLVAASSLFSSSIPTYTLSGRQNQEITLSNGAVFEAHFCSDIKIDDWTPNDELMIFYTEQVVVDLRNIPYFHSQKPVIQFRNLTQDSRISSTMISPPNFGGLNIAAVDLISGQVALSDGSVWDTLKTHIRMLSSWETGDLILIGKNGSAERTVFDAVLINSTKQNLIKSKEI